MDTGKKAEAYYGVVIGGWHYNALGIIRSLGEKGVPVYFINEKEGGAAEVSKYTKKTYRLKDGVSFVDLLRQIVAENGGVPVLFPSGDQSALLIDENYEQLKDWCICPGFAGQAAHFMDKSVMGQFAEQAGFVVPASQVVSCSGGELPALEYPIILKPLKSVDGPKSDIAICRNEQEAQAGLRDFHEKGYPNVLAQHFVHGQSNVIVGYSGCRAGGRIELHGEVQKIREFPVGRGSTSFAHVSDSIAAIDEGCIRRFMDAVDYDGIFDLDIKIVDGVPYFLESNFRNGGLSYAYTVAGFNIPYTWFCLKTGRAVEPPHVTPCNLMCERDDFENLRARQISLFHWLRDIVSTKATMEFNRADPQPFIHVYGKAIYLALSCLFRNVK